MKKVLIVILVIALIIGIGFIKYINYNSELSKDKWLRVKDGKLVNSRGKEVQLRGISTHGIQWFFNEHNISIYTYENMKNLKDNWGINVFRIAMYTDPQSDGYIGNPGLKDEVIKLVEYAIDLDIYVIIDWHTLNDGNPREYEEEAIKFFDELSLKYKDVPNVIYEICNEPNGDVTWEDDVKVYALNLIETIRTNSPKSLIIVGIPDWCKDLDSVLKSPLDYENVMYSVHFYAGSDGELLRSNMKKFLSKGLPIFVTECGLTDNSGDGEIYPNEFKKWIEFLDEKNISYIYWSLSIKDESASIMKIDDTYFSWDEDDNFINKDLNDYLSDSGKLIKEIFDSYKKTK